MSYVYDILKADGPLRSSIIVQKLVKKYGISNETARQRVSRTKEPIRRITGINLPHKEKFCYLSEHFGKGIFIEALSDTLKQTKTAAGRALLGIEAQGGAISFSSFSTVSGATVKKTKKQLLSDKVLQQLENNVLVHFTTDPSHGKLICLSGFNDISKRRNATLIAESIVLSMVRSWIINLGLSSSGTLHIRDNKKPTFGAFTWDIVGPCYLMGIRKFEKNKINNGFIVGDILLGRVISINDLEPFLFKIEVSLYRNKGQPFVAMFIADRFESTALYELRKKGVMISRPETIFGKENSKLLNNLIKTIENAAAAIINDPKNVFDLLKSLSKLEGAAYNLRSVILEFIILRLYHLNGYNIEIRQKVRSDDGEFAEIDIKAVKPEEVVCIECKALSPGNLVNKDEIEDWLENSVPRIKSWLKKAESLPNSKRFEFYTSTKFHSSAKPLIKKIQNTHKKTPINFYTGDDILKRLSKQNQHTIAQIFKEHFT